MSVFYFLYIIVSYLLFFTVIILLLVITHMSFRCTSAARISFFLQHHNQRNGKQHHADHNLQRIDRTGKLHIPI